MDIEEAARGRSRGWGGHAPVQSGAVGGEGQVAAQTGLRGIGGKLELGQDLHGEMALSGTVRRIVLLEPEQEGAFIGHVHRARTFCPPEYAHLVAVGADDGAPRDGPVVHHVHPFRHGVHGNVTDADDFGSGDEGGRGDDGDLDGGGLVADARTTGHGEAHLSEGPLVPLQADLRRSLSVKGHGIAVGIVHRPGECRAARAVGWIDVGPIARAVSFAERGDALDGGPLFIQHLDVEGIGVLAATDRVSFGVEEGRGDRQDDFMRTGIQKAVAGVDLIGGFSISEVPEVGGAEGREALELDGCVEANRRGSREFGMGRFSDFHALLDDLYAARAGDGHTDVALPGAVPLDFNRRRILEGTDQRAAGDDPVVGVLVGVGGEEGGDPVFADMNTGEIHIGLVGIPHRAVSVSISSARLQFNDAAIALGRAAFHDDAHRARAGEVSAVQGVGEGERAAAIASVGTGPDVDDFAGAFNGLGKARGDVHADVVFDIDDVVVGDVFLKGREVGFVDVIGVIEGLQLVGVTIRVGL